MRDRVFYSICFGFVFGVLVRSLIFVNFYTALFFILISLVILLVRSKWAVLASVFLVCFSLGIFRFHVADVPAPYIFESQVGQKVNFRGIIIDAPDERENNQKLTIETKLGEEKTKILASVGLSEDFKYGDEIEFSGELKKPENFITDQGKEFDYVSYLRKDGIYYVMNYVIYSIFP